MRLKFVLLSAFYILNVTIAKSQTTKHVILVSIDGLRPEFYLDASRPTPNLQQLMKKGVYAREMKSVFPAHTYPSHTAMLTGALPVHSGIYHNAPFEPMGITGNWFWFTREIKVPTLWQAMHAAGMKTAAIQWPCSIDSIIDFTVPEIWDPASPNDRIGQTRNYSTKGLIAELEENVTGKLDSNSMRAATLLLDINAAKMGAYLFCKYKPGFLALHLPGLDEAEHEQGREGEKVNAALATADAAIGLLLEQVQISGMAESTTIIITGDHGFADIHGWLQPNRWLAQNGISKNGPEWVARFQTAGGSAFLHLQREDDTATLTKIRQMLAALPVSQRKLFRIVEKAELQKMGADASVTLALVAAKGTAFNTSLVEGFVPAGAKGHHGYDPELKEMMTGFIAVGPGIAEGGVIKRMNLVDVAPLIAKLLGLSFSAPDGVLYPEMFTIK